MKGIAHILGIPFSKMTLQESPAAAAGGGK
ncbi:hypothetical protein FHS15_003999 [Paenibacillus castaneae]|nr:hypothetical protein [Paenibacillus castaneae]